MKLSSGWHKTGLCHVCGKPTKLLIHTECGKKCDEAKNKIQGKDKLSVQQKENAKHKQAQKNWAAGKLPPWAK